MLKISKAALLAAILSLSAAPAIGLLPAAAQQTSAPAFSLVISVPTVLAVGSSMTETALKDVFTSNFLDHANELAALTATSITLPEITAEISVTEGGTTSKTTIKYKDIVLANVKDGLAESLTIGSAENQTPDGSTTYGKSVQHDLNIRRTFEFAGIVAGDADAAMAPIYTSYESAGNSFTTPMFSCTIDGSKSAALEARPAKVSFASLLGAFEDFGDMSSPPPPEAITTFVRYVADLLTGFRGGATNVGALDCASAPAMGTPVSVKLGGIATGDFEPGIYPQVSLTGLTVDAGTEGSGSLAELIVKPTDLNPAVKAIEAETGPLTEQWFNDNWRKLIPSFGGFSFAGVDFDVPNPDLPGTRIQAKIGDFDLTLADYLNGIPTKFSTEANGIEVPLPQNSTDPQVVTLLAAGLDKINFSFEAAAAWDKASKTINVDRIGLSAVDLGSTGVSLTIGNVAETLFDPNPNVAMASSFGITVKEATFDLTDAGFGAIGWPLMASEQGVTDVEAFRTAQAGVAEGMALQLLGSTDAARELGAALGDFITGRAKSLTIHVVAKDPNGIPFPLFMAAQNDPTILTGQVDITGTAE